MRFKMKLAVMIGMMLACAASQSFGDYVSVVQADNPLGYWRLGENGSGNGDAAVNIGSVGATGNGLYKAGVTEGVAGALVGDPNTAVYLDGSAFGGSPNGGLTPRVDIPLSPFNLTTFSVELWARVTGGQGSYRGVLANRAIASEGFVIYAAGNNQWQLWANGGNANSSILPASGADVVLNEWAHLVGTFDDATDTVKFYLNGQLVGSKTGATYTAPTIAASYPVLRAGNGYASSVTTQFPFLGDVDELAFYGDVLTLEEVQAHYAAGVVPEPGSIVLLLIAGTVPLLARRRA